MNNHKNDVTSLKKVHRLSYSVHHLLLCHYLLSYFNFFFRVIVIIHRYYLVSGGNYDIHYSPSFTVSSNFTINSFTVDLSPSRNFNNSFTISSESIVLSPSLISKSHSSYLQSKRYTIDISVTIHHNLSE